MGSGHKMLEKKPWGLTPNWFISLSVCSLPPLSNSTFSAEGSSGETRGAGAGTRCGPECMLGWSWDAHLSSWQLPIYHLCKCQCYQKLGSPLDGCQAKRHNQAKDQEEEGFITICSRYGNHQGSFPKQCLSKQQNWGSFKLRVYAYSWRSLVGQQSTNFSWLKSQGTEKVYIIIP